MRKTQLRLRWQVRHRPGLNVAVGVLFRHSPGTWPNARSDARVSSLCRSTTTSARSWPVTPRLATSLNSTRGIQRVRSSVFQSEHPRRTRQAMYKCVSGGWSLLSPLEGLGISWNVDPGHRSQTRFALGYYLPGIQPFGWQPTRLACIVAPCNS
jgi:hypothetical protein